MSDCSVDQEMALSTTYSDAQAYTVTSMTENESIRVGYIGFRWIARKLALTDTQKVVIKEYIAEYRDCIHSAHVALRDAEKAIVDTGNAKRKVVIDSLKDSLITKAQALADLKTINQDTRAALKNDTARVVYKNAVCLCMQTLFNNIKDILTTDQQTVFEAWVKSLNISCLQ